jgi:predicted ribonuclease YlaK
MAVLDTNVLLHYQAVDQLPWIVFLESSQVRLVIPLRVIEEIDAKKHSRSPGLTKRARKLLPALERLLGAAGRAGRIAEGVTIEVPVDTGPRERPEDADEEILLVARDLAQFSSRDVTVVTGDTAMTLRARAHGLKTLKLAEGYFACRTTRPAFRRRLNRVCESRREMRSLGAHSGCYPV